MEELFVSGSTSTWRDYIVADSGIVALRSTTSGTVTMAYFNGDHLGSTSVLTNASGAVTERDSYDAWGRRRNANGTDSTSCSITSATTRGFTGQEMLDPVCAVNLNARVYDPTIGRIMSADPTVPDARNGQSFNRYSYVENGPLSAIDPSGLAPTGSTCNPDSSGIPHCTYDATTGNSGMPCWGCSGQGLTSNGSGLPVPASDYAASGSYTVSQYSGSDGSLVASRTVYSYGALADALNQISNSNALAGIGTNIQFGSAAPGGANGGGAQNSGSYIAATEINPATGQVAWTVSLPNSLNGGIFVFAGAMTYTRAYALDTIFLALSFSNYLDATYQRGPGTQSQTQMAADSNVYDLLHGELTNMIENGLSYLDKSVTEDFDAWANEADRALWGSAVDAGLARIDQLPPSMLNLSKDNPLLPGAPDPTVGH